MKKGTLLILLATLLPYNPLQAELDESIFALESIDEPKKQPGPFRIEGEFDSICPTNINKKFFEDQEIGISQYAGSAGMAFCYLAYAREAYAAGVSYRYTHLCWNQNPYFSQTDFNQASFLLRFFSNRFCEWIWQGQLAINVDADQWNLSQYTNYDLTLWGRYEYCDNVNLHIGTIIQTGLKMDRVYPVIGFDWEINKTWQLNLVFPMNISIMYTYDCNLSGAFAMRFFDIRHRADNDEELPMALWAYRNSGLEFAILYEDDPTIEANVHVGSTLGGMLRISDKDNRKATHFKLDPALYIGAEAVWSF